MKYLLVPDKFKGSLTAGQVIEALAKGIKKTDHEAKFFSALVSDGGDGFIDSIEHYTDAQPIECAAQDPLGRPFKSTYLFQSSKKAAYIEMAQTAGLAQLSPADRNPLYTSTYGTGLQIKDALDKGADFIYVGLGGSSTNDGGTGIAAAMGYEFLDKDGRSLSPNGTNLIHIRSIVPPRERSFEHKTIYAINDVNNPLYGPQGAAYVYAAQKGADEDTVEYLDHGLKNLDQVVQKELGHKYADIAGAGAAGGTAYGLMSFLGARFIGGTAFIMKTAGVLDILKEHKIDYIITGEGKIDHQTLRGKLIHGIIEMGKEHEIPVIAVCGALDANPEDLRREGLTGVIEVQDRSKSLEYNMTHAAQLIESAISQHFR